MEHDEQQSAQNFPNIIDDSPLYEQGMQAQYFNPTQPLQLPVHSSKERLRYLTAKREKKQQRQPLREKRGFLNRLSHPVPPTTQRMSLVNAALIISTALIVSRFIGIIQSVLFTYVFEPGGASGAYVDAYQQAFLVPDLIYTIVAGGALMSAFIPVFNTYMVGKRDEKTAWHIASTALNLSVLCMILFALVLIIFARQLVPLYNLGPDLHSPLYAAYLVHLDLITTLTRIMLLQAVFMGASVILTSVLNARQNFLLPALAPVLYNLGLIVGLVPGLILVATHQRNDVIAVYSATWGVVLGAFCLFIIQLPGLRKAGMHYTFSFDWRHIGIRRIGTQMLPRVVNAVFLNFSTAVDRILLQLLIVVVGPVVLQGLISQYVFAFGIVLVPLSGVMAVCTAAFPTMTAYIAEGRIDRFRALIIETLRSILFIAIPCSIGLMLLSFPVIQVLYEHGSLNQNEAQSMAVPLFCFAFCLPGLAVVEILTRSFYALRHSMTPVLVSVGQFIIKIALGVLLLDPAVVLVQMGAGTYLHTPLNATLFTGALGMSVLALATSIAVLLEAVALIWLLRPHVGGLQLRPLTSFTTRVVGASLAMAIGVFIMRWWLDSVLVTTGSDGTHSLSLVGILLALFKLVLILGVGSFIYLRVSRFIRILGSQELGSINRLLIRMHLSWI